MSDDNGSLSKHTATHEPHGSSAQARRDLTLRDLFWLIWRQKVQFIVAAVMGIVLGGGVSLALPKRYESHASFVGIGGSALRLPAGLGGVSALASQLGIPGLSGGDASTFSPYFFVQLITTDTILDQLAQVRYSGDAKEPSVPLVATFGGAGRSRADSLQRAVKILRSVIRVDMDVRTGIVKLTVTAHDRELARTMADTVLGLVNGFLARDLRTRAGAQRRFMQDRLAQVEQDLALQQDRLRIFLETNRDYKNSPALSFRAAELQRDLDLKRDIYLSVARTLEEARMNEVRDTPLLSVIDRPSSPALPSGPRPRRNAVLVGMFMSVLWLAFLLLRQSAEMSRLGR